MGRRGFLADNAQKKRRSDHAPRTVWPGRRCDRGRDSFPRHGPLRTAVACTPGVLLPLRRDSRTAVLHRAFLYPADGERDGPGLYPSQFLGRRFQYRPADHQQHSSLECPRGDHSRGACLFDGGADFSLRRRVDRARQLPVDVPYLFRHFRRQGERTAGRSHRRQQLVREGDEPPVFSFPVGGGTREHSQGGGPVDGFG